MIEMYGVCKGFDPALAPILRGLNATIRRGEAIFLTGCSGAGKSTLLKLLWCELLPDQGQILIDGRNVKMLGRAERIKLRRHMGCVFQDARLLREYTVTDNVAVRLVIKGERWAQARRHAKHLLGQAGLHGIFEALPSSLSGGQQQRVALVRALAGDPQLILADEPTGNLDRDNAEIVMSMLTKANQRGTTLVISSHDPGIMVQAGFRQLNLLNGTLAPCLAA